MPARQPSRHPMTLIILFIVIGVAWIAQFWVYPLVSNWVDYLAALASGRLHVQVTTDTCPASVATWAGPTNPDPWDRIAIVNDTFSGQQVRVDWIRAADGNFHWTDVLGGWPSFGMIDEDFDWGWYVRIPLWLPLTITALLIWRWYRRHRPRPGTCRNCGYDLTGNVSGRCPECGTWISEAGAAERATER